VFDTLTPLRERYAYWLGMDAAQVVADREEAAGDIRALQLVLRMERDTPPSWHTAVALAATTVARLCLDERAEPGGEWHDALADYCRGHIRKVTRRGRGAPWHAVQDLPGITGVEGNTEVRALLPGLVGELDKRVAKLQVGGTDTPVDARPEQDLGEPGRPVLQLWLPPAPVMTLGKTMAQAGHAAMIAAALLAADDDTTAELVQWRDSGCPAAVTRVDAAGWAELSERTAEPEASWSDHRLLVVRDAGFTEIDPGTITVIARAFS